MNIRHEKAKELREQAMPEVKKLVKRFGRSIVSGCLQRLADYDKKLSVLNQAKKEVEKLEKELNK
ncbi:MAG: hypothetical protein [Siphoviridae sp. cttb18]|nr:MAG: hypothetical protein [Siphoviridae sp. cttb18]